MHGAPPTADKHQSFWFITVPTLCALMNLPLSHPNTDPTALGMPPTLPTMARLSGHAQTTFWRTQIKALTTAPGNLHLFLGFNFSPSLQKQVGSMNFAPDDPHLDWHEGLGPGVAMNRERSKALAHKRMHDQIDRFGGLGFNLGKLDTQKMDSPAPILPQNYRDFLEFLHRWHAILVFLLTEHCNLALIVAAIHHTIMRMNAQSAFPDQWFYQNGPPIMWRLVLLAKTFFDDTRTHTTFAQQGPVCITLDPNSFALTLIRDAPTQTPLMELPPAFQQLAAQAHTRVSPSPAPAPTPTPPPPPRMPPPSAANRRQPAPDRASPVLNASANPKLVEFFAALKQNSDIHGHFKRTTQLLKAIDMDIPAGLQALNLGADECLNFHARGSCGTRNCRKQHQPKNLNEPAVTSLLRKLTPALTTLKGKAPPARPSN